MGNCVSQPDKHDQYRIAAARIASMTLTLHKGVVAFKPLTPGREQIVLGNIVVGEIAPTPEGSRFPVCFSISLPDASSRPWRPAYTIHDARRQAAETINDWMIAAGLQPVRGAA